MWSQRSFELLGGCLVDEHKNATQIYVELYLKTSSLLESISFILLFKSGIVKSQV